MRLWSIHPKYLDSKGLVALWREALLAQKVLQGATRGYTHHPQLLRFKGSGNPLGAIACYLRHVAEEADNRGYRFDSRKISPADWFNGKIPVTSGQVAYEFSHLLKKLKTREPDRGIRLLQHVRIELHPLFFQVEGDVEKWESV